MSRIGKKPIVIPEGVDVVIEKNLVTVKGPKGELVRSVSDAVTISLEDGYLRVTPKSQNTSHWSAFWGLERSLLANMIQGVAQGFERVLKYEGVGYRANMKGEDLELMMGYSHPVIIQAVKGITIETDKGTITVRGIDKQLVGQVAANIRKVRKPEPYKGKGIRYADEVIQRKAGKKVVGGIG